MVTVPRLGPLPAVGDAVRVVAKYAVNPVMLQLAGRRYWYAARLEHVGRRSGRAYATPVVVTPVAGGFVVPLPYGTDVDWLRNLQAAGRGGLVEGGRRWTVSAPEVRATEDCFVQLPDRLKWHARLWRTGNWLWMAAEREG